MPLDPDSLPQDAETLRKIVMDLAAQLDRSLAEQNKYQSLVRELLEAQRNRKSEQLSNWRCSRRLGERGTRRAKPLPTRTMRTTWMAMPAPGRSETKRRSANAVAARLWRAI